MSTPDRTDPQLATVIQSAISAARRGDFASARAIAERDLNLDKSKAILNGLLGMFCCQAGDLADGIAYLTVALDHNPGDVAVRANLGTALVQDGRTEDALVVCSEERCAADISYRLYRVRAYVLQTAEDFAGAVEIYRLIVAAQPADFESWNNLGNAYSALGDGPASAAVLERAAALRPDVVPVRLNLATTLREIGRWDEAVAILQACTRDFRNDPKPFLELAGTYKLMGKDREALEALENAATRDPRNPDLQVSVGSERVAIWDMAAASDALDNAIALDPRHAEAHIFRALLHEHNNQPELIRPLIADAERRGVDEGAVQFIRALALRREHRFEEGLAALAAVPTDLEPARLAQLTGQFHDRLGNAEAAFAAFTEMNRLRALDPSEPIRRAEGFRTALEHDHNLVTSEWYGRWSAEGRPASRKSPAFLVGFPRSGTTLLDTLLMGHPMVEVLEEKPPLRKVEEALGGMEKLAACDAGQTKALRDIYFEEASKYVELSDKLLLVDKSPLHLNKVPIIHRLFPDARFILALRHPCDVVLSCFSTNFRLNEAMSSFLDLKNTAQIYDLSFDFWQRCSAIMPIRTHSLVYEKVVADTEAELRPLFDYLDLDWRAEVLDHRKTAADRGVITTASYAQVTEQIYDRSSGRWIRYREQLAPIFPILRPWAERFGYRL